ncbi:MAG: cyclic nucleotide-binding domain-containing protein, partial [Desulfomonilaceae bacterium]
MQESTANRLTSPDFRDPFAECPEQVRSKLWEMGSLRDFRRGECIVSSGDPGEKIRFLIAGKAQIIVHDLDGPDIPVDDLSSGDLIGEISFLTGLPTPANSEVIADGDCTVLEILAVDFENVLKTNPGFMVSVLKNLARKVIRLDQSVYKNARKKRALQNIISRENHLFPDYFVGETVRKRVGRKLEELAASNWPVLITGETGVGKEFLAHAMYKMSPHHQRVFLFLDLLRPTSAEDRALNYC